MSHINLRDKKSDMMSLLDREISHELYRSLKSLYDEIKQNNKKRNLLLKEFQIELKEISQWNFEKKHDLWESIKDQSVKKSNKNIDQIIPNIFKLIFLLEQDQISNHAIPDFDYPTNIEWCYHCYLNLARHVWKNPDLLYDIGRSKIELQKNILKIEKLITRSIFDTFNEMSWHYIETPQHNHKELSNSQIDCTQNDEKQIDCTQDDDSIQKIDETNPDQENSQTMYNDKSKEILEPSNNFIIENRNDNDIIEHNGQDLNINDKELLESDIILDQTKINQNESPREIVQQPKHESTLLLTNENFHSPIISRENSFESIPESDMDSKLETESDDDSVSNLEAESPKSGVKIIQINDKVKSNQIDDNESFF